MMITAGLPLQLAAALPPATTAAAVAAAAPGSLAAAFAASGTAKGRASTSGTCKAGLGSTGRSLPGLLGSTGRSSPGGTLRSGTAGEGTAGGRSSSRTADPLLVVSTAAWVCEQVAAHGQALCDQLVAAGLLPQLVAAYVGWPATGSEGGLAKVKAAVKAQVKGCSSSEALQALLQPGLPLALARHVLARLVALLRECPKGRQALVTSGALQRVLALQAELGGSCSYSRMTCAATAAAAAASEGLVEDVVEAAAAEAGDGAEAGEAGAGEGQQDEKGVAGRRQAVQELQLQETCCSGGGQQDVAGAVLHQVALLCAMFPDQVLAYFAPAGAGGAASRAASAGVEPAAALCV
jgi:hypothetical protein